jgi:hypothetical protein
MRWSFSVLAAGSLAALGGCGGVIVNAPIHNPSYVMGDEDYASRNGAIRVEVAGDMLGVPRDEFATRVVSEMRAGYYRKDKTMFSAQPSQETDPRYKIVMMFSPATPVSPNDLCLGSNLQTSARQAGDSLTLLASFCSGTLAISEVRGTVGQVAGIQDPNFSRLVREVIWYLFPRYDNRRDGGGTVVP